MARLRDLANRVLQERAAEHGVEQRSMDVEHDTPQKTAKNEPCSTVPRHRERNGGTDLFDGLVREVGGLWRMPTPHGVGGARWREVVTDAHRLMTDGWAAKAMGLGWSELDLFGASTNGCPYGDGLAAWLRGRSLLALAETWAVARDEHGHRHYFTRGRGEGARLLWSLGR